MAKKEASLEAKCPQCEHEGMMIPRFDLKAASNVTVLQCDICDWEFAKDQSVKIPGNLVRHAAEAMNIHEGYSSLGEYVRDCIRRMNETILLQNSQEQFADFMGFVAENPDSVTKMLSLSSLGIEDHSEQPKAKKMRSKKEME
jgi:hypothetical protein